MTDDTRSRLLRATGELIAAEGWRAVTSRAVAERAGVRNGVVHYHFDSMDDLRRQAVFSVLEEVIGTVPTPEETDLATFLSKSLAAASAFDTDSPLAPLMLEATVQAPRDPVLGTAFRAGLREQRTSLASGLRRAQHDGGVAGRLDADGLAALLVAAIDGLELHRWVDHELDVEAAGAALLSLLGLEAPDHVATTTPSADEGEHA